MTLPTWQQYQNLCHQTIQAIQRLQHDGPELLRRAHINTRDGYPTTSSRPNNRQSAGSHNDPVLNIILADPNHDPILSTVTLMVNHLNAANQSILRADAARIEALPHTHPETTPTIGLPTCANHHCQELATGKAGRCTPCYDYRRNHDGIDAPPSVIDRRQQRRIRIG